MHPTPQAPSGKRVVQRPALFQQLSAAPAGGVTLVAGPAGSGKTVLVRSWLEAAGLSDRAAWVSIERGERDSQRFWLSVVDALAARAGADEAMARVSPAPDLRDEEAAVGRLLSALGSPDGPLVLVIDDLHELQADTAKASLELFLARLPPSVRAVLLTRADPGLGLHRLRVAERLTEVRATALRFSPDETRNLLKDAGIDLSDAGLALLHERTEGWAAGLRLAAISLAEHPDAERFVREFSGSEHTVAGYLLAEVLEHQPAEVRDLLLRTSMLERVSGPLADFVTGASGSERILQELEDANAFVTALDVGRTWFRYHHLFADLLRLELRRRNPTWAAPLHRSAAEWLETHGHVVEAVRHAQAGEDWAHAACLIADNYLRLILDGRVATLRVLLAAFGPGATQTFPELGVAFAKCELHEGRLDQSAALLSATERRCLTAPEELRRRVQLPLAEAKLALARRRGEFHTVLAEMRSLEEALQDQPPDDTGPGDDIRASALHDLGIAELWSLKLGPARRDLEQALALARRIGRPYLEIGCLAHLGMAVPLDHGSLPAGVELVEHAIAIVDAHGWATEPVAAAPFAVAGLQSVWLGRFADADEHLEHAQRALRPAGEPGTELIVHHARGVLRLAEGRFDEALVAFRAAERMQALLASAHPLTHELRTRILQTQVRMGDTTATRAALAELSAEESARADARLGVATLKIAVGDPSAAIEVLGPAMDGEAPVVHPGYAATEAWVLAAAAHEALGDHPAAETAIEHALELAEPEGIILPFTLAPVREVLERHRGHRTQHATLLATVLDVLGGSAPKPEGPSLREPLSAAELRVVRYLPSNLKATEIAAELYVSTNTVRTHLRHIYAKLDAHTRGEAVSRARRLGLLAPPSRLL